MLSEMRNIGIMAHIDAGKTTVTERMLFFTKKIHKIGEIDDGQATMDFMPQEQERGITIQSAAITTFWQNHQINIIDTPGHVDFTAEVERSLRVLDGAIAVLCAVDGVQPQTETVWKQAEKFSVPRICFVNKMDRVGADFFYSMNDVHEKFGTECVALQIPIGQGQDFEGVIDLLTMKELRWDFESDGEKIFESEIDSSRIDEAKKWREKLIETVAASDDELTEFFLEGKEISAEKIKSALRKAVISHTLVPFLMGSARHNQGIQPLLNAIVDFLPSPQDIPPSHAIITKHSKTEEVEIPCDEKKMPVGLVFKIHFDREMGAVCFVRMYSGKISAPSQIFNADKKIRERVNKILRVNANRTEQMESVAAGDIAVFVGLKAAQTGDTITSEAFPARLENLKFPEPVISVAIEPETLSDKDKLLETLAILSREDPTFTSREDSETGQLIISGMGELHLDVLVTRMKNEFGVKANIGHPQVTYRESIQMQVTATEEFEKILGGKENTAKIEAQIFPAQNGIENSYECSVHDSNIPKEIFEAIEQGFLAAMASGIKFGYPCAGVGVKVTKIEYSALTSTPFAFEACAVKTFEAACEKAEPCILEPVMSVEISCPKEFVGAAGSQIVQAGGSIIGQESRPSAEIIHAQSPMSKMFGFSTNLRSVTQGRASFSMEFLRFQKKPGGIGQ